MKVVDVVPCSDGTREVTALLRRWDDERDREALDEVVTRLIGGLRELARNLLARESPNHTLEPTVLVHEAYLRLLESRIGRVENRGQFFAFTARMMRQILVDHARGKRRAKRGGGAAKVRLSGVLDRTAPGAASAEQILAVHEALDQLGRIDQRQRRVVELGYFLGLSAAEAALALEVSISTVERDWHAPRLWLARAMRRGGELVRWRHADCDLRSEQRHGIRLGQPVWLDQNLESE